jgi:hypothetical protein
MVEKPVAYHRTEKIPVLWISAKILGLPGRKFMGVCGKTKRIFKVADNVMAILIINDIFNDRYPTFAEVKAGKIIEEGPFSCEEKERCLNIKCSLNHSTAKSLRINKKAFEDLPIEDHWPGLGDCLEDYCSKNPGGGVLIEKPSNRGEI